MVEQQADGRYEQVIPLLDGSEVMLVAKHVRRERTGVHAELTVARRSEGRIQLLDYNNFNIGRSEDRSRLAKGAYGLLSEEVSATWPLAQLQYELTVFCRAVGLAQERTLSKKFGDIPLVRTVDWDMEPLLLAKEATIVYGAGGAGKSAFAEAVALSMETGLELVQGFVPATKRRAMYLGWEAGENEARRRQWLISNAKGELVASDQARHLEATAPLAQMVDHLAREVGEWEIGFLVIDSLAPASGGDQESAEQALNFFAALRRLHCTSLVIAHTPKNASEKTVFGSVFYSNLARNVWELRAVPADNGITIALYHRKANNTRLYKPIGIKLQWSDETLSFRRTSVLDEPYFVIGMPIQDQIAAVLRDGAKTTAEIAELVGKPKDTVLRILNRFKGNRFVQVLNAGTTLVRWGLMERVIQ